MSAVIGASLLAAGGSAVAAENPFGLVYANAVAENVKGKVNIHPVTYKLHSLNIAANGYTPAQINDVLTITGSCTGKKFLKQILNDQAEKSAATPQIQIIKTGDIKFSEAPRTNFRGKVEVGGLLPAGNTLQLSTGLVKFAPGARTVWHTHPAGQLLVIASGIGRIQQEGGAIIKVYPGDVVWFPAGVKHWHGADENSPMSHYAFAGIRNGQSSTWLEEVKD